MTRSLSEIRRGRGFSLIELSIVLVVFALLAGGLLPLAAGQRPHRRLHPLRRRHDFRLQL